MFLNIKKEDIIEGTTLEAIVTVVVLVVFVLIADEVGWIISLVLLPLYFMCFVKTRLLGYVLAMASICVICLHFTGFKVYGYRNVFYDNSPLNNPRLIVKIIYPNTFISKTGSLIEIEDYKLSELAKDISSDEIMKSLGFVLEKDGTLLLDIEASNSKQIYGKYRLGYFAQNLRRARFFPGKRPLFVRISLSELLENNKYFISSSSIESKEHSEKGKWMPSFISAD